MKMVNSSGCGFIGTKKYIEVEKEKGDIYMFEKSKELLEELEKSAYIKRAEYHEAEDEDDVSGIWIELDEGLEDLDYDVIDMGLSDERLSAESIYNCIVSNNDMGKYESKHNYVGIQYSKNLDVLILFVEAVEEGVLPLICVEKDSEGYELQLYVKNIIAAYIEADSNIKDSIKQSFDMLFKAMEECTMNESERRGDL